MAVQDSERIQAVGISDPSGAARGHAGQPPPHIVTAAQLRFLRNEQPQQRATDIAKADDSKVIGWDDSPSCISVP